MDHIDNVAAPTNAELFTNVVYPDPSLPIQFSTNLFDELPRHEINCHWHNEFQFSLLERGSCAYSFYRSEQTATLRAGDGVFVNSKALHAAKSGTPGSMMRCFTVSPLFFGREATGAIYTQYVYPVLRLPTPGLFLYHDRPEDRALLDAIRAVLDIDHTAPGRGLLYLEKTSCLWRLLTERLRRPDAFAASDLQKQEARARRMLTFIHVEYARDITVDDIAAAANTSRTECFRCFKRSVGKSPADYLLTYRLSQAARLLVESGRSVAEVSAACGFGSPSYFGARFKKHFGVSPQAYRKAAG